MAFLFFPSKSAKTDLRNKNEQEKKNTSIFFSIETWTWMSWPTVAVRMAGGIISYYLPSKYHHKIKTDAIPFFIMQ